MLVGHLDVTLHLVPGAVVFADTGDGPTMRIASFHVSGPTVSSPASRCADALAL
jgi:hypothetical protein